MNIVPSILISILIVAGMILTACVSEGPVASLSGASWKLVSYGTAGKPIPAEAGIKTSLVFGRDGQVSGMLGCNTFSGNYAVNINTMTFSQISSTLMACPDPLMAQENTAFQVLKGTVQYKMNGNLLTIYNASTGSTISLSR